MFRAIHLIGVVSLLALGFPAVAQEWEDPTEEDFKLTASDGSEEDWFGRAVAVPVQPEVPTGVRNSLPAISGSMPLSFRWY